MCGYGLDFPLQVEKEPCFLINEKTTNNNNWKNFRQQTNMYVYLYRSTKDIYIYDIHINNF